MAEKSQEGAAKASNAYNPAEIEGRLYEYWEQNGFFNSDVDVNRKPYTIVIPPPNVTGALHLGHALNNVIQDVLIRYHRQLGFNALWLPGVDHAGIATQSVVEKRLYQEEGKTRHDIGREALVKRIWEWKDFYQTRIINQLKKLGCSCDWRRQAFTMNSDLSYAVRYVFMKLYEEGLIYRGKRLINWCPGCRTALSNDELVHKEIPSHFWHIKYPLKDDPERYIQVATTRPETMLGDTAIAVHPDDERYTDLVGKMVILPLMNREIPIIADAILADKEKGTGAVKVTPAHDPNDYACGMRNNLEQINILNEDGTLNELAGKYQGLFAAKEGRKAVVADLQEQGYLVKIEDHTHAVAHCYRSDDVVEPYLSNQWFVKMQPLVDLAKQVAIDDKVKFHPESRKKVYLDWLDSTPDWCISRQLWWGHRMPIWYCKDCSDSIELNEDGELAYIPDDVEPILPPDPAVESVPTSCPKCGGSNLIQDPNVLDTWFSSQLWPISTFGWPRKLEDIEYYYPTNVLSTARDIIALWVARMIMMGKKFIKDVPFYDVFIHSTILDDFGDIMSKSRGNGIDPVKTIDGGEDEIHGKYDLGTGKNKVPKDRIEVYPLYGTDALRYSFMSMTTEGQDIRLRIDRKLINDDSKSTKSEVGHASLKNEKQAVSLPSSKQAVGQASLPDNENTGAEPVSKYSKRHLPHIEINGSTYFITFNTKTHTLTNDERDIILKSVLFHNNSKYILYAAVVMPDHVHLVLKPIQKDERYYSLSEITHSIKGYSSSMINELNNIKGALWVEESYDRIIRDDKELQEKLNYIVNNPMKAGLIENPEDYKWLFIKGWIGDEKETGKDACPTDSPVVQVQGKDARATETKSINKMGKDARPTNIPKFEVFIPKLEEGKRFMNKIWQVSTGVVLRQCEGYKPMQGVSPFIEDRYMIHSIGENAKKVKLALEKYRISEACDAIYSLFWDDFCSFYVEVIKPRLWLDDGNESKSWAQTTLVNSLDMLLRLMHPIMPYITEEIWQKLRELMEKSGVADLPKACIVADYPDPEKMHADEQAKEIVSTARKIIFEINRIRSLQEGVTEHTKIPTLILTGTDAEKISSLTPLFEGLKKMCKIEEIKASANLEKPAKSAATVVDGIEVIVPLEGLIDFEAEKARLRKEIENLSQFCDRIEKKLGNENYVSKAPAHLVEKDKATLAETREKISKLNDNLASLD